MFLHLDSSIRNWVFFPLTIITICVNLLLKYITFMFNQGSKKIIASETKDVKKFNYKTEMSARDTEIKIKSSLNRANLFKKNFMYLSDKGYKQRKAFFCHQTAGYFSQTFENPQIDLFNPNMSFEMIKKNSIKRIKLWYYILRWWIFFQWIYFIEITFWFNSKIQINDTTRFKFT